MTHYYFEFCLETDTYKHLSVENLHSITVMDYIVLNLLSMFFKS